MPHLVLKQTPATRLTKSPTVLFEKVIGTLFVRCGGFAPHAHSDAMGGAPPVKLMLHGGSVGTGVPLRMHRRSPIRFVVQPVREPSNQSLGDIFSNEHHPPPVSVPHIKSEVHFWKVAALETEHLMKVS